jgi:hypothetical protein
LFGRLGIKNQRENRSSFHVAWPPIGICAGGWRFKNFVDRVLRTIKPVEIALYPLEKLAFYGDVVKFGPNGNVIGIFSFCAPRQESDNNR